MHEVVIRLIQSKWNKFGSLTNFLILYFYIIFLVLFTMFVFCDIAWSPQSHPIVSQCSPFYNSTLFNVARLNSTIPEPNPKKNYNCYQAQTGFYIGIYLLIRFYSAFITTYTYTLLNMKHYIYSNLNLNFDNLNAKKLFLGVLTIMEGMIYRKLPWASIFDTAVHMLAFVCVYWKLSSLAICVYWKLSSLAITLAWINIMVYMRQVYRLGKYVIIISDIVYAFVEVLWVFAIFIIAFGLGKTLNI